MEKKEIKKAYEEILEVVSKYKELGEVYEFRDIRDMIEKAENHLFLINWNEKYGIELAHDVNVRGNSYIKIDDYRHFSRFEDAEAEKKSGQGRYISWEDDGKQPKNEWLLNIGFSTGAYIFGDDYPESLFEEFWQELKSYGPSFCDSHNYNMYFTLENSAKVFNQFNAILRKYHEKNKLEFKQRRIEKLKKELEKLAT